jgi:hypothetical protein
VGFCQIYVPVQQPKEKPRAVYTFAVCQLQIHEKFMRRGLAATEVHEAHQHQPEASVLLERFPSARLMNSTCPLSLFLCLKTPRCCVAAEYLRAQPPRLLAILNHAAAVFSAHRFFRKLLGVFYRLKLEIQERRETSRAYAAARK